MDTILERTRPLYRQLGERIEEKILNGEWPAGHRLPTTPTIAGMFGVSLQTAQRGTSQLARQGLLERIPGRGTFVSRRILSRTIGIAFGSNVFTGAHFAFYQQAYGCLCAELKRLGWNTDLYFPADEKSPERMLAELGQDAAGDRLRG